MQLDKKLIDRLAKIKMLIMDVDGVMSDARIFLGDDGDWRRMYSVRDGAGIVFLREAGYKTGIITGALAADVKKRAEHLKIDYFFNGKIDKGPAFDEIKKLTGYTDHEISYIGDDIFDIPILRQVGFAATVPEGMDAVKDVVHYVCRGPGGNGALRDLCDLIVKYGFHSLKGV